MNNRIVTLLIAVLMLSSCKTTKAEVVGGNAEIIEIPEKVFESVLDFADNYRYITLNVGENIDAALGTVSKMRVFKDKIYVMDNLRMEKLLVFDKNGTFLTRIGRPGRGPLEYVNMQTFEIDPVKEELLLLDGAGKILIYDLDGNYKRTLANNIRGKGIAVLSDGSIVHGVEDFRTNEGDAAFYKLVVCDSTNKVTAGYLKDETNYPFGFGSQNFLNPGYDGTATFAPQISNGIYRVSGDGVEQVYSIGFDDMIDKSKLTNYNSENFSHSDLAKQDIFYGDHAMSDDFLIFEYDNNKKKQFVFYNRADKSAILSNDRLCGMQVTFDEDGNIWGALTEGSVFTAKSGKALEILNAITESENPVVITYDIKKVN